MWQQTKKLENVKRKFLSIKCQYTKGGTQTFVFWLKWIIVTIKKISSRWRLHKFANSQIVALYEKVKMKGKLNIRWINRTSRKTTKKTRMKHWKKYRKIHIICLRIIFSILFILGNNKIMLTYCIRITNVCDLTIL